MESKNFNDLDRQSILNTAASTNYEEYRVMNVDELKFRCCIERTRMEETYSEYKESQRETLSLRKKWERSRNAFETMDLALAELDGRLTIVPSPRPGQDRKKVNKQQATEPATMTMDQVRALAKRVGIELEE